MYNESKISVRVMNTSAVRDRRRKATAYVWQVSIAERE